MTIHHLYGDFGVAHTLARKARETVTGGELQQAIEGSRLAGDTERLLDQVRNVGTQRAWTTDEVVRVAILPHFQRL